LPVDEEPIFSLKRPEAFIETSVKPAENLPEAVALPPMPPAPPSAKEIAPPSPHGSKGQQMVIETNLATREAIPQVENDIQGHTIDLDQFNRLIQGESAILIPYLPEGATPSTKPEMPETSAQPSTGETQEAWPFVETENEAYGVDMSSFNRLVQGDSSLLIPHEPEILQRATERPVPTSIPKTEAAPEVIVTPRRVIDPSGAGGKVRPVSAIDVLEAIGTTIDSLSEGTSIMETTPVVRVQSKELFEPTNPPDPSLLAQFISDYDLRELWNLIEALQEDLIEHSGGIPKNLDAYQKELLQASDLLLQGKENYDDARAIVYRVRGDLKRERKTQADSIKFRPLLLWYFSGWAIGLLVLALLSGVIFEITKTLEVPFFGKAYVPSILGAFGGLLTAYLTLHKHTTIQRDFDPIHIPWYLFTPLVGGLMGFLTFLFLIAGIETTVETNILGSEDNLSNTSVVLWLLAFLAGMNQNVVVNVFRSKRGNINDTTEIA
jgi:hypothetical protein